MQRCLLSIERNWHWCETDTSALKKKKRKKKVHFLPDGQSEKTNPKRQKSEGKVQAHHHRSQISNRNISIKTEKNFKFLFLTLSL